ncbi:MAG: hypothetical protein QOD75_3008 [Blastocatellia bacterium]|jgi:hypothetical protein|nr:hypothetical protein [Blastocatellia bacterium]
MITKRTGLAMFVLALALTAQLSFISTSTRAQNSNSSTVEQNSNSSMMSQVGIPTSRCRRRCTMTYRRCLRSKMRPQVCRIRYRNCLRHCPQ